MARTLLPNITYTPLQPTGATGSALNPTLTAADAVNGNYFVASGRDIVLVYNSDSATHNLSILSAPDTCTGRKADVTGYTIPASTDATTKGHVTFTVLPTSVFTQTDGTVQISADSALVFFLIRSI